MRQERNGQGDEDDAPVIEYAITHYERGTVPIQICPGGDIRSWSGSPNWG
jgi:hypothetical protein